MRSSDAEDRGRVLYLITSDISARFLRGQLAHLIEHGYDVEVGTKASEPPGAFDDGVVVHDLPFEREPALLSDLRALVATARLIRRVRPAIVNASTPKAGLLGMIAARMLRVPRRAYVVRGLRFETASGPYRRLLRWIERLTTACATDIVYNSASLLAVAEGEGAVRRGRGVVLAGGSGNGIDVDRFARLPPASDARRSLGVPIDATVIGFVGRLTHDKGIVDLVDAFGCITESDERAVLLLAGDFEDGDPVPAATRRSIDESPAIVHVPWIDDTRDVYAAMDVLAFPSHREGLPNVPLEAQVCGVPVVAYAATGTVDAVFPGPPNALVPVGDRGALGDAVLSAAHGGDGTTEARAWVTDRFGQHRIWRELSALYATPRRERQP